MQWCVIRYGPRTNIQQEGQHQHASWHRCITECNGPVSESLPMPTGVSEEVIAMAHVKIGHGDTYSEKQSTKFVANVKKVKKVVDDIMIIPFQHDSADLVNIANGIM